MPCSLENMIWLFTTFSENWYITEMKLWHILQEVFVYLSLFLITIKGRPWSSYHLLIALIFEYCGYQLLNLTLVLFALETLQCCLHNVSVMWGFIWGTWPVITSWHGCMPDYKMELGQALFRRSGLTLISANVPKKHGTQASFLQERLSL